MKTSPTLFPIPALLVVICLSALVTPFHAQSNNGQLKVKVTGTGRTTGHVVYMTVSNPGDDHLVTLAQTVYIPSDGKYQPYIGRIDQGHTIPPRGTVTLPVNGYCVDVHRPPCPSGEALPGIDRWIPVGSPTWHGEAVPPAEWSYPVPTTLPAPDVLKASPEREELTIRLRPRKPAVIITAPSVPEFSPGQIPGIMTSPGFESVPEPGPIQATWPGTDDVIHGTIDPDADPRTFAGVVAGALVSLEEAQEVLRDEGVTNTPFSGNPDKEREAVIQQTFWIYTAVLTGQPYERVDFSGKVYEQYESTTGKTVESIPAQEKSDLDSGVADFWNTFAATGVEAKVLGASSPGLDLSPEVLATVSSPACRCSGITYRLELKKGDDIVHAADHTTPDNPKVVFEGFAFGDELAVKILNIRAECTCGETPCTQYPAESTNKSSPGYTKPDSTRPGQADIEMSNDASDAVSENSNCMNEGKQWNADGSGYSFTLKIKDEGTNQKGVYQRLRIKTYCQTDECRKALCAKYITLQFAARAD